MFCMQYLHILVQATDIFLVNEEVKACDFNEEILLIRYSTKR